MEIDDDYSLKFVEETDNMQIDEERRIIIEKENLEDMTEEEISFIDNSFNDQIQFERQKIYERRKSTEGKRPTGNYRNIDI